VRSRRLGAALRRYREAAHLDQHHAAEHIAGSKTKVSRIESGQVSAKPGDVRLLLELYGVDDRDLYRRLEQLARDANKRGWWLDYPMARKDSYADVIALETDATYIRTWQHLFIPGLLQSSAYVRTLLGAAQQLHSEDAIDEMVTIRETRRRVIEEGNTRFAAVIWEPALTAPMPSPLAHRAQLKHLLTVGGRRNISIQVLPLAEWTASHMTSHFSLFSFGPEPAPEAVSFDTISSTIIFEDFEGMADHAQIFETLRSAALTPDQSLSFIEKTLELIPEASST
jgi:transcriptional regulator with XRE-family HTH domain